MFTGLALKRISSWCVLALAAGLSPVLRSQSSDPPYIFPSLPFDEAATAHALEPGAASVRGVASTKSNTIGQGESILRSLAKSYLAPRGTTVTLFPATPYFEEWYALRKKHRDGKKLAVMSNLAYSYRIVTKVVDNQGNFEFRGLKPGKYYLEASIVFTQQLSQRVQTGTEISASDGNLFVNPIYTRYAYAKADRGFVEEFIEVPPGVDSVEVKLK